MDPEVWSAGSLPGGERQVGSSSRGWRIDEARKGSVRTEDLVRMGCQDEEGSRTPRAFAGELKLLEAVGKVQGSSQGWLVGNRHGWMGLAPIRACTHSVEGTEAHHGGQRGSRQQPALLCRSTSRQTAVLLRDVRGVRVARGALDGPWNRELRQDGVELICVGEKSDEVVRRHGARRSELMYVSRQTVGVVEELRCDGVVNCGVADAMPIRKAQCRRQRCDPTNPMTRKNFGYHWRRASIQMGSWRSGALLLCRLAPCPILNYGCGLWTAWNGFVNASALNQTELRAAKRG